MKADMKTLGNKKLPKFFQKINNTAINENTDLSENHTSETTVPCLPISMISLFKFLTYKRTCSFSKKLFKLYSPIWIKVLGNDCITCKFNEPFPHQEQIAEKQTSKDKVCILTIEYHLTQKALYLVLQKKTRT